MIYYLMQLNIAALIVLSIYGFADAIRNAK